MLIDDVIVKKIELAPNERIYLTFSGTDREFYVMLCHWVDGELCCYNEDWSVYKHIYFIWPKYHEYTDDDTLEAVVDEILLDPVIEMMREVIEIVE